MDAVEVASALTEVGSDSRVNSAAALTEVGSDSRVYSAAALALYEACPWQFPWADYQDPAILKILLCKDGMQLEHVQHVTAELCELAVNNNGWALQYVPPELRTSRIIIRAIQQQPLAIRYVHNQTPGLCRYTIRLNGKALQYVKEQTEELCLAAVQQDGFALEYVKNKTLDVCVAAVHKDHGAIQFVPVQFQHLAPRISLALTVYALHGAKEFPWHQYPEPEVLLALVKLDGTNIQYVQDQTRELCLEAVRPQDDLMIHALVHIRNQTPEICLASVLHWSESIQAVRNITPELCLAAVRNYPGAIQHIEQTHDLCLRAVQLNPEALRYVVNPTDAIRAAAK